MKQKEELKNHILAATGVKKAELVLKNARVVNVFTEELDYLDVAIEGGYIVGLGTYEGEREVDLQGRIVCPGFMDGHIHLESSMVSPAEFEKCVLPHGTTTVITDPHEIANVAGTDGIDFMLNAAEHLKLDVYFMLPSCVPSTGLDESGAALHAEDLKKYLSNSRVLGLAEVMDSYGTVKADGGILDKIMDSYNSGKRIDGHAPGLSGKGLNAYIAAGVLSDHECADFDEAYEKLRRGQWIMIREGTAAKNLEALVSLIKEPYYHRCMFVTDDKHPGDLLRLGHMDYIIKKAVGLGADAIQAIKMASYHTALYFGLTDRGVIAPGYLADFVVLDSLETLNVKQVYKNGKLAAEDGHCISENPAYMEMGEYERVFRSFHMDMIQPDMLKMDLKGDTRRVICLTPNELLTTERLLPCPEQAGETCGVDLERDIIKMAVFERHHNTGHVGHGFLHGYGLKRGAVATSVAHDSHNLIIAGTSDADMALAGNCVREMEGGLAYVADGVVIEKLPLPIAGLMSLENAVFVEETLERMKAVLRAAGIPKEIDPFMTLAFASLPVIPKLRLNTYGVIDVERQMVVESIFYRGDSIHPR